MKPKVLKDRRTGFWVARFFVTDPGGGYRWIDVQGPTWREALDYALLH